MEILSEFYPVEDFSTLPISQYAHYLQTLAMDVICGSIDSKELKFKSSKYDYGIIFEGSYAKGRVFFKYGESNNTNQDLAHWECTLQPYYDQNKLVKINGQGLDEFRERFSQQIGLTSSRHFINTKWVLS